MKIKDDEWTVSVSVYIKFDQNFVYTYGYHESKPGYFPSVELIGRIGLDRSFLRLGDGEKLEYRGLLIREGVSSFTKEETREIARFFWLWGHLIPPDQMEEFRRRCPGVLESHVGGYPTI